jgi:cell division protein FtsQ
MTDSETPNYQGDRSESPFQGLPAGDDGRKIPNASAPFRPGSRRVLLIVIIMVFAALVTLANYASRWKKEIVVRAFVVDGASMVSTRELLASMKSYAGRNLQELDASELKRRVAAFPYVRDAFISKEMNGIVRIRVVERIPLALTVLDGRMMAIDRDGVILPGNPSFSARVPKLLEVRGLSRLKTADNGLQQMDKRDMVLLLQFLDALSSSEYAGMLIREFHLADNNQSYCTAVQAPTRFIVGNDGNFKEKLKKFEIFWQKVVSKKGFGAFETVDLRFRDRIFTRDPASPEVPQVNPL